MENMTRYQLVLLVLLVSFITALATGIVSVALINQAPPPVTQTIQRVVEKTVETIVQPLERNEVLELEQAAIARDVLVGDIIARVSASVVRIVDSKKEDVLFGSGFLISSDGNIITSLHIVDDRNTEFAVVMNDDTVHEVEVFARDTVNKFALLKIVGDESDFTTVKLGDSESIKVGHTVTAIGNANVSVGVVSGFISTETKADTFIKIVKTDAIINEDNSGGPLMNLRGEVVALNYIANKAIPINEIKFSLDNIKKEGSAKHPFLGIRYIIIDDALKLAQALPVNYGALLVTNDKENPAIVPGGSAEAAGLMEEDVILEFDGEKVKTRDDLTNFIKAKSIGDKINIKFLRNGVMHEVIVLLK